MSNLLQLKNANKSFGIRALFENASFAVNAGEKVGVIGPNGAGKSTMFKILVGEEGLDSGEITKATGLRLGYLAQEDKWRADETVEAFLSTQSITPLWDLKKMAEDFGLSAKQFAAPIMSLSGGYRMRVKLLHLVASQPDLMLLDEPTNYLDLETVVVLENFLQSTNGAFMLISHDREFLRRTTDHILEIEAGQMTKYAGNIDDYFEQKELLRQQLERAALSAQLKRKEILDFAARFGAKATKARQVQSRLKQLDRIESIEVKSLPTTARIRLPEPVRTGKSVIQVEDAALGYGEKVLLNSLRLELNKGDHLGVVGVNGIGKTTLLKALAGELKPLSGEIQYGLNVEVAYFAQHVAERLKPDDTVLEAMGEFANSEITRQDILDLAGSLLFSGDDVKKKIRVLSGGEKSRVALGQMLLKRASCLLLDEPTNHLDFHTVEALTQALSHYSGTVVIVSHDRGFVRRTASKILELRGGTASFYPGTYDEYVWSVQRGVLAQKNSDSGVDLVSKHERGSTSRSEASPPPQAVGEARFNYKDTKKQIEKQIRSLEREIAQIDVALEAHRTEILEVNDRLLSAIGQQAVELAKDLSLRQEGVEQLEARYLDCLENHERLNLELAGLESRFRD
jgi:ATP-binding cassette, subfamily F, member 3